MNLEKLILYGVIIILVYKVFFITEKLSNDDITAKISELYKADVGAIRNLSKLANDLTKNGKLVIPGGLEVQGDIKTDKNIYWFGGKGRLEANTNDGANIILNNKDNKSGVKIYSRYADKGARIFVNDNNGNNGVDIYNNDIIVKNNMTVNNIIESKNEIKTRHLTIDKGNDKYGGGMAVYGAKDEPFYINYYTNDNRSNRKGYMMFGSGDSSKVFFSGDIQGSNLKTGYKLLYFQLGDAADHDTGYSSNDWVLTVAGVNIDWNNTSPGRYEVFTYIKNGKWYLRSEIESAADRSGINVLAIPRSNFAEVSNKKPVY